MYTCSKVRLSLGCFHAYVWYLIIYVPHYPIFTVLSSPLVNFPLFNRVITIHMYLNINISHKRWKFLSLVPWISVKMTVCSLLDSCMIHSIFYSLSSVYGHLGWCDWICKQCCTTHGCGCFCTMCRFDFFKY